MIKKLALLIAFAILVSGIAVACISDSATTQQTDELTRHDDTSPDLENQYQRHDTLTLYTYYADSGKLTTDKTIELLRDLYPNLTIEVEHRIDSDGAVLKTRAAIGDMPDILESTGTLTDIFAKSGDILPLNDVMEKTRIADYFVDGIFDNLAFKDDQHYALSASSINVALFFYNKLLFEELDLRPPVNFEEFKHVVATLRSANLTPLSLFAAQKWPGLQIFDYAVIAQDPLGLMGLEDESRCITDEPYVQAAEKIAELVSLGLISDDAFQLIASEAFKRFELNQAGMVFNGSWFFFDTYDYADQVGYFTYNPFSDPGTEQQSRWRASGGVRSTGGFAVSRYTEDPEFAKYFLMDFVKTRAEAQILLTSSINVFKEEIEPIRPRSSIFNEFISAIDQYKTHTKFEWSLDDPQLITILEVNTEKIYTGEFTAEAFIEETHQAIQKIRN